MNNPFTLSFGKKPLQYVSRISQTQEIIEKFNNTEPTEQIGGTAEKRKKAVNYD